MARRDFRREEGQHEVGACRIAGACECGLIEVGPVELVLIAEFFAGERTVAKTDQRHEAAGGISKDMTEALRVGFCGGHGGKECVAGAEGDHHEAGFARAHADERCGVVASEGGDLAIRRKAVFRDEVGRDFGKGPGRWCEARKLFFKAGSGRLHELAVPGKFCEIHQVHACAIAEIDRGRAAGEDRCDERTHEVDVTRAFVGSGIALEKAADLRAGETLDRDRTAATADFIGSAKRSGDFRAFDSSRGVHPNRRSRTRKRRCDLRGKVIGGIESLESRLKAVVEIDRAVLLTRSGDAFHLREVDAFGESGEQEIKCREPEQRVGMDLAIAVGGQKAFWGFVFRQIGAEVDRALVKDRSVCGIDEDGAQ